MTRRHERRYECAAPFRRRPGKQPFSIFRVDRQDDLARLLTVVQSSLVIAWSASSRRHSICRRSRSLVNMDGIVRRGAQHCPPVKLSCAVAPRGAFQECKDQRLENNHRAEDFTLLHFMKCLFHVLDGYGLEYEPVQVQAPLQVPVDIGGKVPGG